MKRFTALFSLLFLAACGSSVTMTPILQEHLKNPLYAEQYWEDLVDRMMQHSISKTFEKDAAKQSLTDNVRTESLAKAQEATKKRGQGILGPFATVTEQTQGLALFVDDTVYFGPGFMTYPGPALHVYLTTELDPSKITFPDPTAVDLGLLLTPYGAQSFAVVAEESSEHLRTVVLWDEQLGRMYAFAQMNR